MSAAITKTKAIKKTVKKTDPRLAILIRKQGVEESATFDALLGSGRDLWRDDNEFESFLEHLASIRREVL